MSRWLILVALMGCATGCATGGDEEVTVTDAGDASVTETHVDSYRPPFDGPMDAIFPVDDTATAPGPPKVCDTPMGTTATASGAYMSTPEMAIDRNLGSAWNSGDNLGWIRLKFPAPVFIDRVRLAAHAAPACNIVYVIHAAAKIGEATRAVTGSGVWLEPIPITPGTYSELLIDAPRAESWIAINEVRVFDSTGGCP